MHNIASLMVDGFVIGVCIAFCCCGLFAVFNWMRGFFTKPKRKEPKEPFDTVIITGAEWDEYQALKDFNVTH